MIVDIHVELVDGMKEVEGPQSDWSKLLKRNAGNHVLLAWWKWLSPSASLNILNVRHGDELLAVVPRMVTGARHERCPVRRLDLFSAGWGYGGISHVRDGSEALSAAQRAIARLRRESCE